MSEFFNNVLNVLIRGLPFALRITLSVLFLLTALICFMKSINRKGENFSAINWGWFTIFGLLSALSVIYVTL